MQHCNYRRISSRLPSFISAFSWNRLMLVAGVASSTILVGCFWVSTWWFEPVKQDRNFQMFNRYYVQAEGLAEESYTFDCHVTFVQPHYRTANIDTIPIFTIDSICFEGQCVDRGGCYRPMSHDEVVRAHGPYELEGLPKPAKDLHLTPVNGTYSHLRPQNFYLRDKYRLLHDCSRRDVKVRFHARLIDRLSGKTLAQESRFVQFEIKKVTRPTIG